MIKWCWYAGLTKDNEIVPTKQCYAHAFVILAASSGVLACREGAAELLKDALALYDLRFWNEEEGLPVIPGTQNLQSWIPIELECKYAYR